MRSGGAGALGMKIVSRSREQARLAYNGAVFEVKKREFQMTMRPENRYTCAPLWLQAGIACVLCATLLGCIGATPLHKRTRTPEGTEVKDIDLSFLHPGQTTCAEVKENSS